MRALGGLLRETVKEQGAKLTGKLITYRGYAKSKSGRSSVPTKTVAQTARSFTAGISKRRFPPPPSRRIRFMVAIGCELQLDLSHFDIHQAFVQAELKEVVRMRMPLDCGVFTVKVLRLNSVLFCWMLK